MADRARWEGLGIPSGMLKPGLAVMVAVGRAAAVEDDSPAVICYAEVVGRAPDGGLWLLDVHVAPGTVLHGQTFRADEILGVPALGLAMPDLAESTS